MLQAGALIRQGVTLLLWGLVGLAKVMALGLLLGDSGWAAVLAWLALAWGLAAVAVWWRGCGAGDQ